MQTDLVCAARVDSLAISGLIWQKSGHFRGVVLNPRPWILPPAMQPDVNYIQVLEQVDFPKCSAFTVQGNQSKAETG